MMKGAIIGIGKIAQSAHLPAFDHPRVRNKARIVAAVDPSAESRSIAAQRFPGLRYYETTEELFAKEQVAFIDICATPSFHGQIIREAIRRRLHILCEKPFAASLPEARRLHRSLSEAEPVVFFPCHQYRYSPLWSRLRSFVCDYPGDHRWLLQCNVFRTGADPGLHASGAVWRVDREVSGGGILADTGVHYLYLTPWIMGQPTRVTARGIRLATGGADVEDTALVVLESPRGIAQIALTWAADRRANSAFLLSKAGSMMYDGTGLVEYGPEGMRTHPVPDAAEKTHYVSLYVSLIEEFLGAIEGNVDRRPWIDEAFRSIQLLDACYRSADTGETIILRGAT